MPSKLRSHLTYANVMATVAVFVALGGSSYAAIKVTGKDVPKDALTGADIKNLTGKDVRNNSLTGADVKNLTSGDVANGRLLAEDFAAGQLPAGGQGPKGEQGLTGEPGPPNPNAETLDGIDSTDLVRGGIRTYEVNVSGSIPAAATSTFVSASCDSGDLLQSGGYINLSVGETVEDSAGGVGSWTVEISGTAGPTHRVTTRVRCYDLPPLRP